MCVFSRVLTAKTCVCVCRFQQYLIAEAAHSEIRVCVGRFAQCLMAEAEGCGGEGPHDSQKVIIVRQRACLQSATFWRPGKVCFYA